MNKTSLVIYSIIILSLGLSNIVCGSIFGANGLALAQMNETKSDAMSDDNTNTEGNTISTTNTYRTFSAVGAISSLNFDNNSVSDIAIAKKVVLSGHWSLYVNNGTLSFFEVDFTAAPADGGVSHTHQIVNFMYTGTKPIQLTSNGSTSIVGIADVKINGVNLWNGVKSTVLISKGSTITIILDDMATHHHFTRQPIYGIVERLMF